MFSGRRHILAVEYEVVELHATDLVGVADGNGGKDSLPRNVSPDEGQAVVGQVVVDAAPDSVHG